MKRNRWIRIAFGLIVLALGCRPGPAEPEQRSVHVITSGGFAAAYDVLGPRFEQSTHVRLVTEYGASMGGAVDSLPERLARGEPADIVIMSRPALDALVQRGDVVADSRVDLADSRIGMAVRSGALRPDITSPDGFVEVLLAAQSIGYSASVSGTYLSTDLFPRLGIWDRLEPKSVRVVSERVGSAVARGAVEIGFQQISEILPIEGVDYVGPIPQEYQKVSTFSAGLTMRANNPDDARALLAFLSSGSVAGAIAGTGLEPRVPVPAATSRD